MSVVGLGLNLGFVVVMAILSYRDGFLYPSQVLYGKNGTCFLSHGASLGDLVLMSLVMGKVVSYADMKWNSKIWPILAGFAVSGALHVFYLRDGTTSPTWAAHSGELTDAGWVHLLYQSVVLWMLLLFYFCTPHISRQDASIVSVLLALHIIAGVVQPTLKAGKSLLDVPTVLTVLVGWAAIAGGYFYLTHNQN